MGNVNMSFVRQEKFRKHAQSSQLQNRQMLAKLCVW